jgi:hypothetical protein
LIEDVEQTIFVARMLSLILALHRSMELKSGVGR